jgi:hypothetical protein
MFELSLWRGWLPMQCCYRPASGKDAACQSHGLKTASGYGMINLAGVGPVME